MFCLFQGVANSSSSCLSCYYTCHSCSGPNDYEVRWWYLTLVSSNNITFLVFIMLRGRCAGLQLCSGKILSQQTPGLQGGWLIKLLLLPHPRLHLQCCPHCVSGHLYSQKKKEQRVRLYHSNWHQSTINYFSSKQSLLDRVKSPANKFRNVAKGLPGKISSTVAYNDYDDSSSEVEDFVKPYSDEPDQEKFLKPYRDDA